MKKIIFSLILASIVLFAVNSQETKVAIVDFNVVGMSDSYKDVLREQLAIAFEDIGQYQVIEHGVIEKARGSLNAKLTHEQALEIGKEIKSDIVVLAKVAKFDGSFMLNVRGLNVETGNTEFARKQTANSFTQVAHIMNYLASPQAQPQLSHTAHKYKQNQNHHNRSDGHQHDNHHHGNTQHPNYNRRNHYNHNNNLKPVTIGHLEVYPVHIGWTTWDNAIEKCENFNGGGYSDWRLPSIEEMHILVDNKNRLGINQHAYWTSESDTEKSAWQVNPYNQLQTSEQKSNYHCVRCVRTK